jgi:hypothetical protein
MKTLMIILALVASSLFAKAQTLQVMTGAEQTVAGSQFGGLLLFQLKSKWGLGAFYQAGFERTPEQTLKKDPFYGAALYMPLSRTEKINFYATLRCGLVNENFVAVVPGVETQMRVFKRLGASFGMGYRMGYPAMSARITARLF